MNFLSSIGKACCGSAWEEGDIKLSQAPVVGWQSSVHSGGTVLPIETGGVEVML